MNSSNCDKKLIYPKFYFCSQGKSDRDFVLSRMEAVPWRDKLIVSKKYEKLYFSCSDGRKVANTYLNNVAKEYRAIEYKK